MILALIIFGVWLIASLASGSAKSPEGRRKMLRDGAILLAVLVVVSVGLHFVTG